MATDGAPPGDDHDWIDKVVAVGARLGLNEVRLRWRLMGWVEAWQNRRHASRHAVEHALYENKVCPFCGALNDRAEEACHRCGELLPSHRWQILARLGLVSPIGWTISSVVALLVGLAYARVVWGSGDLTAPSFEALVLAGAGFTDLVHGGEWWRLVTAPWLAPNLARVLAVIGGLVQVGPLLERHFGRLRVLGLMGLVGATSSAAAVHLGSRGLFAGASGVVLGLAAFGVVWGHREGTRPGTELRAQVSWWGAAYAVVAWFVLPHFDRLAHVGQVTLLGGAAGGALLGALVPVRAMIRGEAPGARVAFALVGALLVGGGFLLLTSPPVSPATLLILGRVGG